MKSINEKMAKHKQKNDEGKFKVDEVYPNSPLIEVVCEIRFPGDIAIECRRDEFYSKIKDKYPEILIPQMRPKKVMSFEPYRFENKDKSSGVMLAINKFSFYEKKYEGHKKFTNEFKRLCKLLGETYSLAKLDRIGWRYINLIPFSREDGTVPIHRFLTLSISSPKGISDRLENVSMVFISKVSSGSITTKVESVVRADRQQEALVLDFDFAMTERLHLSKLGDYVTIAHEHTRTLFEDLITDEYRQYLRGETI